MKSVMFELLFFVLLDFWTTYYKTEIRTNKNTIHCPLHFDEFFDRNPDT